MKKRRKPNEPYERKPWTAEDDATMRAMFADTHNRELAALLERTEPAISMRAAKLGLKKSDSHKAKNSTKFKKGLVPWNTGQHYNPGGRSAETRFKPGGTPLNSSPLGALRINSDGNVQRKISNEKGGPHKRWRNVSELVWIEANGPVPPGHIVVFRSGCWTDDPDQITPDKVECISRAERMLRNSSWNRLPPEVAKLVQLKGCINRQVNRINTEQKERHEQATPHHPTQV